MASRSVLVEETQLPPHFEALLQRRQPCELGLLVGKLAVGSRDFALAVVPTPWADGEPPVAAAPPPAAPTGKKGKPAGAATAAAVAALPVDEEWICEHARQVGRMLPGGLCVLGLYAFCGEASFRGASAALGRAAAALPQGSSSFAPRDAFLLLHADSGARARLSARRGEALRPAELKPGRAWAQFHCVGATLLVSVRLPAAGGAPLRTAAAAAVAREAARAAAAEVTWQGALPAADAALGATLGDRGALPAAPEDGAPLPQPAMLQLWPTPPCVALAAEGEAAAEAVDGVVALEGVIALRAYVYAREPFSRAAADLKADAATSLAARLDALIEEAERDAEAAAEAAPPGAPAAMAQPALLGAASAAPPGGLALPRRVVLPWRAGAALCDYALPGEALDVVAERAGELLGDSSPLGTPSALESEAAAPSVAHAAPHAAKAAKPPAEAAATVAAAGYSRVATSAAVAVLAAAVGYLVVNDDKYFDLF